MKLKVFFAKDGDCLLLTSQKAGKPHHLLVDGGRKASFKAETWPVLEAMAKRGEGIDLVVVSHIDDDHISGIVWLIDTVAAWEVFDFQKEGGNTNAKRPKVSRPPAIAKLWHNSWKAQYADLDGPVQAALTTLAANLPEELRDGRLGDAADLGLSIPNAMDLTRTIEDATPIVHNDPFEELVLLRRTPHVEALGSAKLTVLGPTKKHLETLREDWRKWIDDNGEQLDNAAHLITLSGANDVTPPNRASITLLAEEKGRTCLLTGDAAEDELLEGLKAAGRMQQGHCSINVVKIQHHGSEFNMSTEFAGRVIADEYLFCADGAHQNPNPSIVKTLVETRLAEDAARPFGVWFNCSPKRTLPGRRASLKEAIAEATQVANKNNAVTVHVLEDDKPFFELTV